MRKRSRRRQAKRSGHGTARQQRQAISRRARELYDPAGTDGDEEDAWESELEKELAQEHKRGRTAANQRRARSTPTSSPSPPPSPADEQRGRVVSIASGTCWIDHSDGCLQCVLPSNIARDQQSSLAVGDEVGFVAHSESDWRISRVFPRRSTLSRPDPRNFRRERVIAANIDIAIHVASVIRPPLRQALIDRYVIAIGRGGARIAVCVNKVDLLPDAEARKRELEPLEAYRELGLEVLPCSAVTGEGIERLRELLGGRLAVFVGHSGVGKSSLINALAPEIGAKTGSVSAALGKGRHTTTRSDLYHLPNDIQIIDTPGIREFGLHKLSRGELHAFFPDLEEHSAGCRFTDCGHDHEPDCNVRAAVDAGELPRARYSAYLRILESLQQTTK